MIDSLHVTSEQLYLGDKTKDFCSLENQNPLFCPPDGAAFQRGARGLNTLISKNVVAVQSNKRQAKTEMNAGFMAVMFTDQTCFYLITR